MEQRILNAFKESFLFLGYEFYSSISVGISIFPDHGDTTTELMKLADQAMYEAKKKNANTSVRYNHDLVGFSDKALMFETRLHQAIRKDTFSLHYQPKMNSQTGEMAGMEALIRWQDPVYGFVQPDQFIPFAEECGLIVDIGKWVLRTAVRQVKEWNETFHLDLRVAINISPKHLDEPDFVTHLEQVLAEGQVDPAYLELEITEMSMMNQKQTLIDKIHQIKALGVTISIDDFGTGYSSLSYLKTLPINTLKIDQTFIRNISNDRSGVAMVEAIIKLAHALNLSVVAEGVETQHELDVLKAFSCEYVQGYLFSKPLPTEEFTKKLAALT